MFIVTRTYPSAPHPKRYYSTAKNRPMYARYEDHWWALRPDVADRFVTQDEAQAVADRFPGTTVEPVPSPMTDADRAAWREKHAADTAAHKQRAADFAAAEAKAMGMRTYFAAHAPQAPEGFEGRTHPPLGKAATRVERQAQWAVAYADALLMELTK